MKIDRKEIINLVLSNKFRFVLINIFIALLGFLKSYVVMKYLSFEDVGLLTIITTTIELFSLFQLGFINGGYRMYLDEGDSNFKKLNNVVFSYFTVLFSLSSIAIIIIVASSSEYNNRFFILIFGLVLSIMAMVKNWCSNLLIAKQQFARLNYITLISTIISFGWLFIIPYYGLIGSILLISSQPLIFFGIYFYYFRDTLPTSLISFDKVIITKIMKYGFIPFLLGLVAKLDSQIERYAIMYIFNLEKLGIYNLTLIYISIFSIIPSSIFPIFFPKTMGYYKENNEHMVIKVCVKFFLILLAYCLVAFAFTYFVLPGLIHTILPKYNIGLPYVWYIFPYLLASTLILPFSLLYNTYANFKVISVAQSVGLVFFVLGLFTLYNQYFSLEKDLFAVPIIRFVQASIALIICIIGTLFFMKRKKINYGFADKD